MRRTLTVKSLVLLFAFMAGFSPPVPGTGSAEAQVRSSGREVSRQAVRDHRQGSVNRTHRGQRPQVNRSHVNRGQVYRGRTVVRHHRPAHVVVVHPRRHWNRGGAIAAGAAIGFIAGAAAVSWAGQPPRSGYCWFYTTPARTTGFWDWCPVR
jgi:hypothetical protein